MVEVNEESMCWFHGLEDLEEDREVDQERWIKRGGTYSRAGHAIDVLRRKSRRQTRRYGKQAGSGARVT